MARLLREGRRAACRSTASTALTQTCPTRAALGRPVLGRRAGRARARARSASTTRPPKTILPTAGSTAIAATFDPITGRRRLRDRTRPTDQADTATYRTDPVPAGGYTLMGSPTVVADITSPGSNSQIAARLLDVDPGANTQTLVARGLWRPAITREPGAAGVPAAPERLQVRRRSRREARAAAEGLGHGGRQQLRPRPRTASRT